MKKEKSTLKRRFSFVSLIAIFFCVALFSVIQFYLMDDIYALAAKISMLDAANEISQVDFENESQLPLLSDFEASKGIYIEIYNKDGGLIYTSKGNDYIYNPSNESRDTLLPRNMKLLSHSDRADGSYFEMREEVYATAQYIVYGSFFGKDNNSMQIYYPVDTITKNAETASWTLFALCIVALCLFYVAVYIFAAEFSKPLITISLTAKKIADLDFSQNCPKFRINELDELSKSINALSSSLENALNDLKGKNIQLERDIEKERSLEKSRREFVANASHELKTPISIIQAYAEGMKYGIGCDSTDEFCDIIIEESEKMNSLVVKLLEFLHIGSGEYPVSLQEFYLDELLISHLDSMKNILREKEVELDLSIVSNLPAIGDPTLIRIVFNNYVSNALSHLNEERKIRIGVTSDEERYTVTVFNSGEKIAENDIGNIWQSFYRADKAHGRSEGRFGLGLSIVASIQQITSQDYGVKNKEDGVEFFFTVRKGEFGAPVVQ